MDSDTWTDIDILYVQIAISDIRFGGMHNW